MQKLSDLEVQAVRLASDCPMDTVIVLGKCGQTKIFSVLRGRKEVFDLIESEASSVKWMFEPSNDDNK